MFNRIHQRLGTAGLIVAVVALVVALSGTALAAKKFITKQEAIKIAKKYAGKNGAPGAQGPAGPQGAKGDTGAKGDAGAPGKDGENGEPGQDGEDGACSVSVPSCVLPAGATITGVWGVSSLGVERAYSPISFNLHFASEPTEIQIIGPDGGYENPTEECSGSVEEPKAKVGYVCVYESTGNLANIQFMDYLPESLRNGLLLDPKVENTAVAATAHGSWAATGK